MIVLFGKCGRENSHLTRACSCLHDMFASSRLTNFYFIAGIDEVIEVAAWTHL